MMKGGFNSSFIEIRTLDGDKFINELNQGEVVLSSTGYVKIKDICKRVMKQGESVFNIYYHNNDKEGVLDRVSGDQIVYARPQDEDVLREMKAKDLSSGYMLKSKSGEVMIDNIEKMETLNKYFYTLDIGKNNFYADGICIKNMCW